MKHTINNLHLSKYKAKNYPGADSERKEEIGLFSMLKVIELLLLKGLFGKFGGRAEGRMSVAKI